MQRSLRLGVASMLLASTALATGSAPTLAACSINIAYDNRDSTTAKVHLKDSKVKIRYGVYKKLGTGTISVGAHQTLYEVEYLDFGCNNDRRYKFKVTENGRGSRTIYRPSSSGWTRTRNLTVRIDF